MQTKQREIATATVNYLPVDTDHPQIFIDADGEVGRRIDPVHEQTLVTLHDVREGEAPKFASHGLEFVTTPSKVSDFDEDQVFRAVYDPEIDALIKEASGAQEVVIFDHTVRVDDDNIRRPARHVHGDYSATSGPVRLRELLGDDVAAEWEKGHYGIINVWRPIKHPVQTAPLAFADPTTVQKNDWIDIDIIYPNRRGQITGLKRNDEHHWLYMSEMTPEEVVVFTTFDSSGTPAIGHSAADLTVLPTNAKPRQSIETRALVRFD